MNTRVAVILLIAGSFLALTFWRKKHALETRGVKGGLGYNFLKNTLEFLIPFVLVVAFYLALLVFVSANMDSASLERLIWMEEKLSIIKSWVSWLKLSAVGVVIGFAVLFLIGLLRIPFQKQLSKGYDWFLKMSKWAYIVLVLLCSFTLLGTQSGEPTTNLQVRIKTIREGYADLCKQAQVAVSGETAAKLFDKARSSLPPNYIAALELPKKIEGQASAFRDFYQTTQREYGIKSGKAEAVLVIASSRNKSVSVLQSEYEVPAETKEPSFAEPNPKQISYQKLEKAKASLEQYQQSRSSKVITFLRAESGKNLTMKLPKVLTSKLKSQFFSPWIESRPILGPLVDVFFKTFDSEIEEQVGKAVDKVVSTAIEKPDSIQKEVEEQSSGIADQKSVSVQPQTLEKAFQSSNQLEKELADIQEARSQVDHEIVVAEQGRIDKWIAELGSPKEEVRERASTGLSRMGSKISKSQVDRLVNIMRRGGNSWTKFLYREEGHHCSWWERVSIKYYAAVALQRMSSPHVSSEIANEASNSESKNKTEEKRTDPGWI
jgi:hypothetical protein